MAVIFRGSGGQLNTDPKGFLGGVMSNTAYTSDTIGNVFDKIPRNEALLGRTEFRCIYILNTGAGHISGAIVEVVTIEVATPLFIPSPLPAGVATSIVTEDTVPTGVKFFGEDIASSDGPHDTVKLPLGLLKANEAVAIWLKRVTETGGAQVISVNIDVIHDAVTLPGDDVDDGGAIGELLKVTTTVDNKFLIGTARIGFSEIST